MARTPRRDWPGARHHVMNRGARRAPIFIDDNHCAEFLILLAQLPERFGLRVHGFALMPNHFHLMLESQRGELSRGLAFLQARYSLLLNRHQGWDGPLFRARFRSKVVNRPEHWQHLLAYLHLNPLRAHLVMSLEQSRWTSHRAYLGQASHLDWLATEELLGLMGGGAGYTRYLRQCMTCRGLAPDGFEQSSLFQQGRVRSPRETKLARPEPLLLSADLDEEMARAGYLLGVELPELLASKSGRAANLRRQVTIWWLVQHRGIAVKDLARTLGVSSARISQIVKCVEQRSRTTPVSAVADVLLDAAKY